MGTALQMTSRKLLRGVQSERVLLVSDACHAEGFSSVLKKPAPKFKKLTSKSTDGLSNILNKLPGRVALLSSRANEQSYELRAKFKNSIFTFFFLKGLRGEADKAPRDGTITLSELYDYVYDNTLEASDQQQTPVLCGVKQDELQMPIFRTDYYEEPLKIWVEFIYEDERGYERQLTNESVLKSGRKYGLRFRPESDCYVYVFWWDSTGASGMMFPNRRLSDGTGQVSAGRTYWLPYRGKGERWYVLNDNVGEERIYFVASRKKNPTLHRLCTSLLARTRVSGKGSFTDKEAEELARETEIMGPAPYTEPKHRSSTEQIPDRGSLPTLANEIRISGADAVFELKFRHVAR